MELTQNIAANNHAPPEPRLWVAQHADYLYAYTITRVNDEDIARDLVQETFLAALQGLHNFKGNSTERTWLVSILKNKIVDVYRKNSRLKSTGGSGHTEENFFDEHDGHWNVDHRPQLFGIEHTDPLEGKEFMAVLRSCMKKLPDLWLAVFTMKHMDDEPTDVICTELKVSPSNFWVIIHRAKVNLRACLQKHWI